MRAKTLVHACKQQFPSHFLWQNSALAIIFQLVSFDKTIKAHQKHEYTREIHIFYFALHVSDKIVRAPSTSLSSNNLSAVNPWAPCEKWWRAQSFVKEGVMGSIFCTRGLMFWHSSKIVSQRWSKETPEWKKKKTEVQVKDSVDQAQWKMICWKIDVFRSEANLLMWTFGLAQKIFLPATQIKHFCR